jgi:hypothetical protein
MGSNNGNTLEVNFDKYRVLFKDLFYGLLQISVTVFLLIAIVNITKHPADAIYPIDLNNPYYTDEKCDLTDIKAGETEFCEGFNKNDPNRAQPDYSDIYNADPSLKPGKSYFSKLFRTYAQNMGYVTGDSFSMFLLWLSYLAYSCDHFLMIWLNGAHSVAQMMNTIDKRFAGIALIIIASLITHYSSLYVNPFLTTVFFPKMVSNHPNDFFTKAGSQVLISFLCMVILILLFFIVPCTIYYIIALFLLLFKNLSIQINVLSIFAIYLCIKALRLFIDFMISQFGKKAIEAELNEAEGKKLNRQQDRIHKQNIGSDKQCDTSDGRTVYKKAGRSTECISCPTNGKPDTEGSNTIVAVSDGVCGIVNEDITSEKQCNNSTKKGGAGGFWLNEKCVISPSPDPEDGNPDVSVTPLGFKRVVKGKNKVVLWESK